MAEKMQTAYRFDFVHDAQKVFRELLSALANPGEKKSIEEQAGRFEKGHPSLLALGCTLLDNEEGLYVEKNPALSAELHSLTLAREAGLCEADYVFLSSELNYGSMEQILKNVKYGTYADPQQSATIFLLCKSVDGEENMTISGPGIKGEKVIQVCSYIKKVIRMREKLDIEYPLGVDLIFTDGAGNLLAIPRLVKIAEEDETWHM